MTKWQIKIPPTPDTPPIWSPHKHQPHHIHTIINHQPITQKDINTLNPTHTTPGAKWINGEIIDSCLYRFHQNMPHNNTRQVLTTYQMHNIRTKITQHTTTRQTRSKTNTFPYQNSTYLIIPVYSPQHWTLIVRHTAPQTKQITIWQFDTQTTTHHKHSKQQDKHDSIISNTPYYTPTKDRWQTVHTITQPNSFDCGPLTQLIAYIYLNHPDPQNFQWAPYNSETYLTNISSNLRHYITQTIINSQAPPAILQQISKSHTQTRNSTHTPKNTPKHTKPTNTSTTPTNTITRQTKNTSTKRKTHTNTNQHHIKNKQHKTQPVPTNSQPKTHITTIPNHTIYQPPQEAYRFASWNIQKNYNPTKLTLACIQTGIDYLTCQEPGPQYSQQNTPLANAAQSIMTRAGYTMHATTHIITITNDKTLTPMTHSAPIEDHTGRLQAHTFTQKHGPLHSSHINICIPTRS